MRSFRNVIRVKSCIDDVGTSCPSELSTQVMAPIKQWTDRCAELGPYYARHFLLVYMVYVHFQCCRESMFNHNFVHLANSSVYILYRVPLPFAHNFLKLYSASRLCCGLSMYLVFDCFYITHFQHQPYSALVSTWGECTSTLWGGCTCTRWVNVRVGAYMVG